MPSYYSNLQRQGTISIRKNCPNSICPKSDNCCSHIKQILRVKMPSYHSNFQRQGTISVRKNCPNSICPKSRNHLLPYKASSKSLNAFVLHNPEGTITAYNDPNELAK